MTRLRPFGILLAGLLLVLAAAPAGAWPWDTAPKAGPDPERPVTWGRTTSADHPMRAGCHRYGYRYAITPPTDEWSAELFLTNSHGKRVGSAYYLTPQDAARGAGTWKLCRSTTGPGRYTIRMRITYDRFGVNYTGWARSTTFRMTRVAR